MMTMTVMLVIASLLHCIPFSSRAMQCGKTRMFHFYSQCLQLWPKQGTPEMLIENTYKENLFMNSDHGQC